MRQYLGKYTVIITILLAASGLFWQFNQRLAYTETKTDFDIKRTDSHESRIRNNEASISAVCSDIAGIKKDIGYITRTTERMEKKIDEIIKQ